MAGPFVRDSSPDAGGGRPRIGWWQWGLLGGLAATLVIDLLTMAVMPLLGWPATAGFAVIGDTAAAVLSRLGIPVPGGVVPGLVWHYVIGLLLGVPLAAAVTRIPALRLTSAKKAAGLGILYTELISLPILVLPPLLLPWTQADALMWFGFSFVMHAIYGLVLGLVLRRA